MTAYGGVERSGARDARRRRGLRREALGQREARGHRVGRRAAQSRGPRSAAAARPAADAERILGARDAERIVGETGGMRQVLLDIEKVARTDANVLITRRERHRQGTGGARHPPPVAAQRAALRQRGPGGDHRDRCSNRSCSGIARARSPTRARIAPAASRPPSGGTLFLDEIGNLSLAMQAKLLGALETHDGDARRLRSPHPRRCARDLRHQPFAGAAARSAALPPGPALPHQHHRDPHSAAARTTGGHPAADRATTRSITRASTGDRSCAFPTRRWRGCGEYRWPGNVRELKHAVERAVIMSENGIASPSMASCSPPPRRRNPSRTLRR